MAAKRKTESKSQANLKAKVKPFSKVGPPTAGQPQSTIMNLPAELRNMIFREYFEDLEVLVPTRCMQNNWGRTKLPPLLLACKQLHAEATGLYYLSTTFKFPEKRGERLKQWLKKIGTTRTSLIRRVRIDTGGFSKGNHPDQDKIARWFARLGAARRGGARAEVGLSPQVTFESCVEFDCQIVWTATDPRQLRKRKNGGLVQEYRCMLVLKMDAGTGQEDLMWHAPTDLVLPYLESLE